MQLAEPLAGLGERPRVGGDGLVDGGVGGEVVVLALELAVEPAREVAYRLGNGVFCVVRHGLPGGAVAFDLDQHGVLVVVATALADDEDELVEVAPLYVLKIVGDGVQGCARRGVRSGR